MQIANTLPELIGNTPLLRLERFAPGAGVLAKLESFNPLSSAKDRAGLYMILDAEERGLLQPGAVIVEPTSGNTGVALAYIGRQRGYRVVLTMPETMSQERRSLLAALGAELVLTEGARGMGGAIERAKELLESTPGAWMPDQFNNPANARAHYETTGPELWRDTDGGVDVLVAGVGSGGTITGAGRYLKEQNPAIRVVAVEPAESPVLSGGRPGPHKIQGIGAGFVPGTLDMGVVDEVVAILDLVDHIMSTFGFQYEAEISTRPEKSIGTDDMWEHATNALKEACARHELAYDINEGDGAFYGPKIDIKVKDAIGRTWQCSTVQVDFNMPERFELTYRTEDNTEERPWMLHRAIFGSIERFLGILIEHYAGALPLWLAPVQVAVLPLADRHNEAAHDLALKLADAGGRVEVYDQNEPMRVKIAKAQSQKIPYMVVLGDKEIENGTVSVRERHEGDLGAWPVEQLVEKLREAAL